MNGVLGIDIIPSFPTSTGFLGCSISVFGLSFKMGSSGRRWTAKKPDSCGPCALEDDQPEREMDDLAHSATDTGNACSWKGDAPEAETDDLAHGPALTHQHPDPVKEGSPCESFKSHKAYFEVVPESQPAPEPQPTPSVGAARSRGGSEVSKDHDSDSTKTVTNGMPFCPPTRFRYVA